MRHKGYVFLLLWGLLLAFPARVHGDVLYTKSGESFEGHLVEDTGEKIVFDIEGGQVDFSKGEVERIEPKAPASLGAAEIGKFFRKLNPNEVLKNLGKPAKTGGRKPGAAAPKSFGEGTWVFWTLAMLIASVQIFTAAGAMVIYFRLAGGHVGYRDMLWFQVQVLFLGVILSVIAGLILGFSMGGSFGRGTEEAMKWYIGTLGVVFLVTHFIFAKNELDAGFGETMMLAGVIFGAFFVIAKLAAAAGIYETSWDLLAKGMMAINRKLGIA